MRSTYVNHSAFVIEHNWNGLCDPMYRKRIFILSSYHFCVSINSNPETENDNVCDMQLLSGQRNSYSTQVGNIVVELEVPSIGPHRIF